MLHPSLWAVSTGVAWPNDNPGCSSTSQCQLACHQGYRRSKPQETPFQVRAEETQENRHSQDHDQSGTTLPHHHPGFRYQAVAIVGDGKGAPELEAFLGRLKTSQTQGPSFCHKQVVGLFQPMMEHLPEAIFVFVQFHIIKLDNDGLSDVRRRLYHDANTTMRKEVIKGTPGRSLKDPEHIDKTRNEAPRLKAALELNQPLATAYYMKEDFSQFWSRANNMAEVTFLSH